MKSLGIQLSCFALGALLGAGALALVRGGPRSSSIAIAPDVDPRTTRTVAPEEHAGELPERTARELSNPPQESRAQADLPLFSEALIAHAREELAAGWRQERSDEMPPALQAEGMQSFEQQVLALPRSIGWKLSRRETQREQALEDLRTGGVFAALERLDAGDTGPMLELVRDRPRFEAFFAREAAERSTNGPLRIADDEPPEDGVTLTFPAGVFELEDFLRKWSAREPLARDLTLSGAGMGFTLFVGGDFSCSSRLRNLRLRDCTIFSERGGLFDLRREAASVALERVRLCGFDTGAGSSSALDTQELAIHLVECEIAGGYGRSPTFGKLFDVRTDALLARFDRCTISSLRIAVPLLEPGATVVFSNCTLRDILDDALADAEKRPGVLFDACSFTRSSAQPGDAAPRKDLNELFPNWRNELQK